MWKVSMNWKIDSQILCTNAEIGYLILGNCGKNIFHHITKNLEILMLIVAHKVNVHKKQIYLANFLNYHKI